MAITLETDKGYFFDMVCSVNQELEALPADSPIRQCFSPDRLNAVRQRIESAGAKDLQWAYWQPLFLFLRNQPDEVIAVLDDDLRAVLSRSGQNAAKVCAFLRDERDFGGDRPWIAGLFETFAKARLCKSDVLTLEGLDWPLQNGKNVDARVRIGNKPIHIECMTRGESDAGKTRWREHCQQLTDTPDAPYLERQDAYTAGRMLYGSLYNKLAPGNDIGSSQLTSDVPNIVLISLSSITSDLGADTPAIGWALDELFGSQPNGGTTPISLQAWLLHDAGRREKFRELIAAPKSLSAAVLFDGCALKHSRINYNAHDACRISHQEMARLEDVLLNPPLYGP